MSQFLGSSAERCESSSLSACTLRLRSVQAVKADFQESLFALVTRFLLINTLFFLNKEREEYWFGDDMNQTGSFPQRLTVSC